MDIDVELRGVAMAYGAMPVLHDLDLAVHKGEFLSLLGPSGCGKTTTLNIIGGFLTPLRGTVTLGGRVVNDVPPYRRNTGMVFQSYALFPHMSVFDNVAFGLKVRRVGAADIARRVREALALVQLEGLGKLGPEQLAWLEGDLRGRSSSTPIVVFAHIPLWAVYPRWGWGTSDSEQSLGFLKRFGSVTVLNGHIHQVLQKVEGNVTFHTAMSTAFPQPAPGSAPAAGPMKVPAERLRQVLGITNVNLVAKRHSLAIVDSPLVSDQPAG